MSEPILASFVFGRFQYDGRAGRLLLDGREVPLPPRELHLLGIFLERPAEWLGEEWLAHGLWPQAVPPTGELDRLVRELTAALDRGADGVTTIQSLKKRGYRWLLPVRRVGVPAAEAGAPPSDAPAPGRIPARAPAIAEARSAHRMLVSPRRLAIGLLAVGAFAGALSWTVRAQARRAARAEAAARASAPDPAARRSAAAAEVAKGVAAARQSDPASRQLAMLRFEAALELDPSPSSQAVAHAGLAATLILEDDLASARREAEAAVALDGQLADAHAALAMTQLFSDRDAIAARASAERALALDVGSIGARRALAWVSAVEGRFETSFALLLQARSPTLFDPELATDEGTILYLAGRALEARRQLNEVVLREPASRRAHGALAALHLTERRLGAAAVELELRDALGETGAGAARDVERIRQSAGGAWTAPDAGEAARQLEERARNVHLHGSPGSELEAARIFAQFGERDLALAALARALEQRESAAALARIDPAFTPLRSWAAFRDLLDRSGVPPLASP